VNLLNKKISLIGAGAMGGTIIERLISAGFVRADAVLACDVDQSKVSEIKHRLNVMASVDNRDAARFGDAVVIAVPPKQAPQVLEEIKDSLSESQILISVVGLVSIVFIEDTLRSGIGVARVMPNIPSLVGSGFNVISFGRYINSEDKQWVKNLLNVLGEYREIEEEKMEIYSLVSAMGPTYFLPFVETLIEFGGRNGLTHEEARKAVASALRGTGDLLLAVDRSVSDLNSMIGTQPLKARDQDLRSALEQELERTFQQISLAKSRFARRQG
jgi:pyrroline-5-carboxylate reductase